MATVTLAVFGRGKTWQVEPNAKGTVIGRSPRCDVVLESRDVSREHARIFQDPFGRWIVEDLGSSNGIFINGRRIEACAVLPGEPIVIGSFSLLITQPLDQRIKRDDSIQATTNIIMEDFETEIFYAKTRMDETAPRPCPKQLDEITKCLSELTSASALYPEVCRHLAWAPKTVAAVLRMPEKTRPIPKSPEILACHFGHSPDDKAASATPGLYPSQPAFRVSHHVLEEVRSKGNPIMAKSIYSSDFEITYTALDEHSPRAVMCAPLGDVSEGGDLLYLDIPIEQTTKPTPEEMFQFVQAVSRQVVSTRKSLILMQLKAQRSVLDHELSLARKIQSRLAPAVPQDLSGLDLALYYKPTIWVGGDYCDLWLLKDGRLAFAVGHVSGNGLPTAIVMSNLQVTLRTTMSFCSKPSEVMKHVNSHLVQNLPQEVFGAGTPSSNKSLNGNPTLFLGLFDPSGGTLEYVNAGHLPPLIVRPPSTVTPLGQADNPALGVSDTSFRTSVETIQQDAQLLVFTNGITEAKSPDGEEFGVKRLMHLLKTADDRSAGHTVNLVTKAVTDFRQMLAQQDDITLFVLVNHKK